MAAAVFDKDGFFERLQSAMAQADVTQAELARRLHKGQATLSEMLSKGSLPRGDTMVMLPRVLGVSSAWLFFGQGPRVGEQVVGAAAMEQGVRIALAEMSTALDGIRERYVAGADPFEGGKPTSGERAKRAVEDVHRTDAAARRTPTQRGGKAAKESARGGRRRP